MLAYLPRAAREERLDARRGDPRFDRQRADVAEFLLSHRSGATQPPRERGTAAAAASRRRAVAALRLRAGQQVELFPLVQHARRGTAGARGGRRSAEARRSGRAGAPHAERRSRARVWPSSSPATGSISAALKSTTPSIASASRASTTNCARRCSRSRSASSRT